MTSIGSKNTLLQTTSLKPVLKINARLSRSSPCINCNAAKKPVHVSTEKTLATAGAISAAAYLVPQFANAAQEVALLADGEPLIVQAGWAALAASFTMSIALVVWGRSGL